MQSVQRRLGRMRGERQSNEDDTEHIAKIRQLTTELDQKTANRNILTEQIKRVNVGYTRCLSHHSFCCCCSTQRFTLVQVQRLSCTRTGAARHRSFAVLTLLVGWKERHPGSYSLKHIVRAIEQRSYDLRRRYDTTYSQNVSQTVIVSYVRYDIGASSLTNVLHFDRKNATRCAKTRYFDKKIQIIIITIIMNWLVS